MPGTSPGGFETSPRISAQTQKSGPLFPGRRYPGAGVLVDLLPNARVERLHGAGYLLY
jgi:hypothetical protein